MKRFIFISMLALLCLLITCPSEAQTLEQAKQAHIEKSLDTTNGKIIKEKVDTYSKKYGVDPILVHAVIMTESGYNQYAKSHCGATGLMQLMPATFKARNVGSNIYSIDENIHAGTKHLAGLIAKYQGNVYLALAAYNAGGGYVDRFKGKVPPSSKHYVDRVMYHKTIVNNVLL